MSEGTRPSYPTTREKGSKIRTEQECLGAGREFVEGQCRVEGRQLQTDELQ